MCKKSGLLRAVVSRNALLKQKPLTRVLKASALLLLLQAANNPDAALHRVR